MEAVSYNPVLSRKAEEDYKLVRQAVAGNQRAYSLLMDRYWNSVYQMMQRMVNNPEDACDLTQEAFGKAFTKLAFYAPTFAFSTWLPPADSTTTSFGPCRRPQPSNKLTPSLSRFRA